MAAIGNMSFDEFGAIISGTATTSSGSKTVIDTSGAVPKSPYGDENRIFGPTNVPICARGLASTSNTGIAKANKSVAHVCNFSDDTLQMFYKAGAMGGQIIAAIRKGIKALLKALGFQPSSNGFVAELKKIAKSIKNALKFLTEINDFINGFIKYVAKIKQLINFLLTLPKAIFQFFKDCYDQAIAALKKGFLDAVATVAGTDKSSSEVSELKDTLKSIEKDVSAIQKTAQEIAAAPAAIANALVNTKGTITPDQFNEATKGMFPDNQKDPDKYKKA